MEISLDKIKAIIARESLNKIVKAEEESRIINTDDEIRIALNDHVQGIYDLYDEAAVNEWLIRHRGLTINEWIDSL